MIRDSGGRDALTLLSTVLQVAPDELKPDIQDAIGSLNASAELWNGAQNIWYGISLGSVLLLAAIGLAITFGVMGIINMAHGEMVMLGAYTTFSTFEFETHALVEDGAWVMGTANMALSLVVGFVAVRLGVVVARTWLL